jgi:cytochrome c553
MKATFEGTALAAALTLGGPTAWAAGDLAAVREKAAPCGVCHGNDGIATRPDAPNIAGQTDLSLRAQLTAYRPGQLCTPS